MFQPVSKTTQNDPFEQVASEEFNSVYKAALNNPEPVSF